MSLLVSKEEAARRLVICNNCENKFPIGICRKCGCIITFKTKANFTDCPEEKWNIQYEKTD